jgi:ribosome-associated protein
MEKHCVKISTEKIGLSALLKWANVVASGGEAKQLILSRHVTVNGKITTERAKSIYPGDNVCVDGQIMLTVEK